MKIKSFVFLLLTFLFLSQTFSQTFERTYPNSSVGTDVQKVSTGGFVTAGKAGPLPYLMKTDELGQVEWNYTFENQGVGILRGVEETSNNDFLVVGNAGLSPLLKKISIEGELISDGGNIVGTSGSIDDIDKISENSFLLLKSSISFNQTGDDAIIYRINDAFEIEDSIIYSNPNFNDIAHDVLYLGNDKYSISGTRMVTEVDNSFTFFLYVIGNDGNIIWEYLEPSFFEERTDHVIKTLDNGLIVTFRNKFIENEDIKSAIKIIKFNQTGTLLWEQILPQDFTLDGGKSIIEKSNGELALTGFKGGSLFLMLLDENGNYLWQEKYGNGITNDYGLSLKVLDDSGFIITGTINGEACLLRTDSIGHIKKNIISGRVSIENENDCEVVESEIGIKNWVAVASNNDVYFYDYTDNEGNYELKVDSGEYQVSVTPLNQYWSLCENQIDTGELDDYDSISINFQAFTELDCPHLQIDISTPFLRRCFDTNYTVNYCNQGTIPAENAYIEITFDQYLTPNSSTLPWTSVSDQTYTFELGDVAVQDCGSFQINVTVGCEDDGVELGQIHCVEAHIYPDSLCNPVDPLWDGSNIIVDAECESDSVRFFIRNTGEGNMDSPQEYIIIEDHIIFLQEPYEIPSGEEIEIAVPTDGIAYRMETAQNPGHPIGNMPSINVEGCNVEDIPDFLLGFWNTYPDDDISPFISVDCQQNVGSFDPNDKQAFPTGYGEEHYIEANTEIEYLIRFQNTGTDTAFTVVVEDVLTEYLDITSIRPGASSHAYDFDIENGRKLKFTFNNILLPDSTTNEAASHGFIKFKIQQVPDNQTGTMIENSAAIFFDFNAPVITNTVFHEIGEDFIESIVVSTFETLEEEKRVLVHPNPFSEETIFAVKGVENSSLQFTLYDTQGREVRREIYQANSFKFLRKGLSDGLYFYRIEQEGILIDAGKIVVN